MIWWPPVGVRKSVGTEKQPFEGLRWNGDLPSWPGENWVCQNDPKSGQHNSLKLIANPLQSIISRPDGLSATHRHSRRLVPRLRYTLYC